MSGIILPNGVENDSEKKEPAPVPCKPGPWKLTVIFDTNRQSVDLKFDGGQYKTWTMIMMVIEMARINALRNFNMKTGLPEVKPIDNPWEINLFFDPEKQEVSFELVGKFGNWETVLGVLKMADVGADDARRMTLAQAIQNQQKEAIEAAMIRQQLVKSQNPYRGKGHR